MGVIKEFEKKILKIRNRIEKKTKRKYASLIKKVSYYRQTFLNAKRLLKTNSKVLNGEDWTG